MKYELKKQNDWLWILDEKEVYSYLLKGTERNLLIDTGFGPETAMDDLLKVTGEPPLLVNTHAHGDHLGRNAEFFQAYIHPEDIPFTNGECEYLPLSDGQLISLGDTELEIIWTPGHTDGSVCLLDRGHRVLFSGDTLHAAPPPISAHTPRSDKLKYKASLEKLLAREDEFDIIYPSHAATPIDKTWLREIYDCLCKYLAGELETASFHLVLPDVDLIAMRCAYGRAEILTETISESII